MKTHVSILSIVLELECLVDEGIYDSVVPISEPPYIRKLSGFYKKLYREPLLDKRQNIRQFKPRS